MLLDIMCSEVVQKARNSNHTHIAFNMLQSLSKHHINSLPNNHTYPNVNES